MLFLVHNLKVFWAWGSFVVFAHFILLGLANFLLFFGDLKANRPFSIFDQIFPSAQAQRMLRDGPWSNYLNSLVVPNFKYDRRHWVQI